MVQLSVMKIVSIEVDGPIKLSTDTYVRHIILRDEDDRETEVTLFSDRLDDLNIRSIK